MSVERTAAEGEAVQVGVGPAEGDLQHLVDYVEREIGAQVEPPPDGWCGVVQVDADPVARRQVELGTA